MPPTENQTKTTCCTQLVPEQAEEERATESVGHKSYEGEIAPAGHTSPEVEPLIQATPIDKAPTHCGDSSDAPTRQAKTHHNSTSNCHKHRPLPVPPCTDCGNAYSGHQQKDTLWFPIVLGVKERRSVHSYDDGQLQ